MLEQLTLPVFSESLHSVFQATPAEGQAVELELIQVRDRGSSDRQERFSVLFHGPLHAFLPQRMYRLEHPNLGSNDLFLVPVGKDEHGFLYEAVFNRLK